MRHSLRAAALLVLLPLAACGGDGTGPSALSLGGNWQYAFNVSNTPFAVSCSGSGSLALSQSGSQFSGTANGVTFCSGPGGDLSDEGVSSVTGGQVDGNQVSMQFLLFEAGCSATGTATGSPANSMSGTASCSLAVDGQTVILSGMWQASR